MPCGSSEPQGTGARVNAAEQVCSIVTLPGSARARAAALPLSTRRLKENPIKAIPARLRARKRIPAHGAE